MTAPQRFCSILLFIFSLHSASAQAISLPEAQAAINDLTSTISDRAQTLDELTAAREQLAELQEYSRSCLEDSYEDMDELAGNLTSQFHASSKQRLSSCQALRDSTATLINDIDILIKLKTAETYRQEFEDRPEERLRLSEQRDEVTAFRTVARTCIDGTEESLAKLSKELEVLAPSDQEETESLQQTRDTLLRGQKETEKKLADCKVLLVHSEWLLGEFDKLGEKELAERLAARTPSVPQLVLNKDVLSNGLAAIRNISIRNTGLSHLLNRTNAMVLVAITLLMLGLSFYIRSRLKRYLKTPDAEHMTVAMATSFASSIWHYLPALLVTIGWFVFWLVTVGHQWPWPLITVASLALIGYLIAIIIGRALFNPVEPAVHYLPLDVEPTRRYWRALNLLLVVVAIGASVFLSPFEKGLTTFVLSIARTTFVTILVFALVRVVWLAFALQKIQGVGLFRPLFTLALLIGLIAEWSGYHNLSVYIVGGIAMSLVGISAAWLLSYLTTDVLDGLDQGRYKWERRLREQVGIARDQGLPGVIWLRLTGAVVIWGCLILFLLRAWGLSEKGQEVLVRYLTEGFVVGPMTIAPVQIAIAVALFAVLLSLVSWMKTKLDTSWLRKTRIDRGAREAAVTVSGYVGVAIVAIIALGVAGVDFKNVALIAGALSVGIGFGLQNIVNNFVSGLILLFERPIRTGDWIVVGNTEGYVKNISIRSTQILTFDRANVIVPNSQLISDQVTNWTLRDLRGRVKVPIGVAYGSDLEKIREILLKIAQDNSMVITNGSLPAPHVFFMEFGDNSLNLELRFFATEIEYRMRIVSDINFAIDAAFREAGIEIPFPQRDVHLRSGNQQSLTEQERPPADEPGSPD